MIGKMNGEAVEAVRDRRTRRTTCGVVGAKHEVVDEKLRAPAEEVGQRRLPFVGLEAIGFIDLNPWKLLTKARQFVAVPRKLLLRLEQLESRAEPLLTGPGRVFRHHSCLLRRGSRVPRRRSTSQRGREGSRRKDDHLERRWYDRLAPRRQP